MLTCSKSFGEGNGDGNGDPSTRGASAPLAQGRLRGRASRDVDDAGSLRGDFTALKELNVGDGLVV